MIHNIYDLISFHWFIYCDRLAFFESILQFIWNNNFVMFIKNTRQQCHVIRIFQLRL